MFDVGPGEPGQGIDPVLPRLGEELLAAYLGTEVVDADGVVWSGAGAVADLDECWVITAENPFSELVDPARNAAANARLAAAVEAAGFATVHLVGRAPDLSWSENCIAVRGATWEQVGAWGREHGQHAVFVLTASTHTVVSCWGAGVLGSRERVRSGPAPA